jgi:formiminoglutamate deiminase
VRYDDGRATGWAARVEGLQPGETVRIGSAIHSIRAVPRDQLGVVVEAAEGRPLHVHLSEQVGENDACLRAYGASPTRVLADAGVLGPLTSAVHATHLTVDDVGLLGEAATYACFCPTTERDLGDGIGPSRALHDAGSRLTLGSDSHAVIDPFEEMRAVELDERLATQRRGHWTAAELLGAATRHDSLGWDDAGEIAVGRRADLVTIATDRIRTAGTGADEQTAVFAAVAEDVTQVVADGRIVFREDDREQLGRDLDDVIGRIWS